MNIDPTTSFPVGTPDMPADIVSFIEHYRAVPKSGVVPTLQSFLDMPPYGLMARVIISDMLNADDFRVRFCGTEMVDFIGKDYTGISAKESRAAGVDIQTGSRAWEAASHPCGYFAHRLIFRRAHATKLEAVFELSTVAMPISCGPNLAGIVNYHSIPRLASDQRQTQAEFVRHWIKPICWIDVGAGVPDFAV